MVLENTQGVSAAHAAAGGAIPLLKELCVFLREICELGFSCSPEAQTIPEEVLGSSLAGS